MTYDVENPIKAASPESEILGITPQEEPSSPSTADPSPSLPQMVHMTAAEDGTAVSISGSMSYLGEDNTLHRTESIEITGEFRLMSETDSSGEGANVSVSSSEPVEEIVIANGSIIELCGGTMTIDSDVYTLTGTTDDPVLIECSSPSATEQDMAANVVLVTHQPKVQQSVISLMSILPWVVSGVLLLALVASTFALVLRGKKSSTPPEPAVEPQKEEPQFHMDAISHIGKRKQQQDSYGFTETESGAFALVADGMGGLEDGDKVSKLVVQSALADAKSIRTGSEYGALYGIVANANRAVTRMLGRDRLYKSGSTMIAVLVDRKCFQWISVGDSRIYLLRADKLLQLNRDHNMSSEYVTMAINGTASFSDIWNHPNRTKLTSFIGMGALRNVDASMRPAALQEGDRLILLSDGVFNTLSEEEITRFVLKKDTQAAVKELEERVLAADNPKQDNFTAVIVDYS